MKLQVLAVSTFFSICLTAVAATPTEQQEEVAKAYEEVSAALVKDDMELAKKSAQELQKLAKVSGNDTLAKSVEAFRDAETFKLMREQFKKVSREMIKLVEDKEGYFIMTCPMAKAEWVQSKSKVANPYMGQKMPACGMIKSKTAE